MSPNAIDWLACFDNDDDLLPYLTYNPLETMLSFFIKTLYPKTDIKSAKYLTQAQITQFFTGIVVSFGVLLMGERCDTQSSRFSLACLHVYGYGLIALFTAFAKRKYKSK